MRTNVFALATAAAVLALGSTATHAQAYPSKPIRIIVPFPPGGFNDILARIIVQKFTDSGFGQSIVDNRPGAGSTIGADLAAKAPPDGHTILIVAVPFAVNASLYARLPYSTEKDFAGIIHAGTTPNLLVVHPSLPVKTVRDLVALAKAKPAQLAYASSGSGTSNHVSMELFKLMTKVDIVHVPYKGSVPAVTDLIGGHTQMIIDNLPNVVQHARAGRLRAVAVTSLKRAAALPDVSTVDEAGVPGYETIAWFGAVAPAATPRDIIARLNSEVGKLLQLADVRERFSAVGVDPVGGTPEQFDTLIRSEIAKWARVVKAAGARVD
jgi:tripartite-type tricarboxylate transporter receptor subunit TctC